MKNTLSLSSLKSSQLSRTLLALFLTLTIAAVPVFALVNAAYASTPIVWAWGRNDLGQLGIGNNNNDITEPTAAILPAGVRGWSEFYAGPLHNMAISTDGRLFVWGCNGSGNNAAGNPMFGKLGIGSTAISYNTPQPIPFPPGVKGWQNVQLGLWHTLALCVDGNLFAWGRNREGQLGIGSSADNYNTPQLVPRPAGVDYWVAVAGQSSSQGHSLAIANTGELFAWGYNQHGQLGLGNPNTNRNTPQLVPRPTAPIAVSGWSRVYTGQGHTLAICANGNLFSWGQNQFRQLGLGGQVPGTTPGTNHNTPQPVTRPAAQLPNWDTLYVGTNYVRAITPDGRFIGWGQSDAGQLGTGFDRNYASPVEALLPAGITGWHRVFSGNNHTLAVTHPCANYPHGRWFAWGWNMGERLGLGPNYPFPGPGDVNHHRNVPTITYNMPIPPAGAQWTAFLATHTALVYLSPRDGDVPLTKTLRLNEGTIVPGQAPFTFELIPRNAVRISNDPIRYSQTGVPNIANQTITIDPTTATAPNANGVFTVTGNSINLWTLVADALDGVSNTAGTFVWELRELSPHTTPPSPSTLHNPPQVQMHYDETRFQVRAHTNRVGQVQMVTVYRLNTANGNWEKIDEGPNFTNAYTRIVGDSQRAALYIRKNVAGEMANLSTRFNFEMILLNPAITPPDIGTVTAVVVNANTGVPVSPARTYIMGESIIGPNVFTLAHDEKLRIPQLPAGTRFQITENARAQFRPEATVAAIPVPPATGTYPQQAVYTDLFTETYIIHQTNLNEARFTNTYVWDVPAGLLITSTPWAALGAAGLLLAVLVTARSRKRIEELPLVP